MSTTLSYHVDFHIERRGHGARREIDPGPTPALPDPGRVPRIARLMALALRFDEYLRTGQVADHAALAELGHVSRARISQITNLLNLAPGIQEGILFLPLTLHGRDAIHLHQLQPIASTFDWRKQRAEWQRLTASKVQASSDKAVGTEIGDEHKENIQL